MKLHFMHYLHVIIALFSAGLYTAAFSTYSFGKLGFLCFGFSFFYIFFGFSFFYIFLSAFIFSFCFEFSAILNNVRLNNILQFFSHFIQMVC